MPRASIGTQGNNPGYSQRKHKQTLTVNVASYIDYLKLLESPFPVVQPRINHFSSHEVIYAVPGGGLTIGMFRVLYLWPNGAQY